MSNKKATDSDEFEKGLLEKPEIRKEYEALKPKYDMIRGLIERGKQGTQQDHRVNVNNSSL